MKKEKKEEAPKFYDVSEDTIQMVEKVMEKMSIPFKLKINYLGVSKQNTLIKLKKISPEITQITMIDLLVLINEDFIDNLDEDSVNILIHQELDKLSFNVVKGTFKLGKFRLQTNEGIINKYGIDAVGRANQLSELFDKQKKDKDSDEKFDVNSDQIKAKLKSNKKSSVEFE